tara:strand:+ start:632 stop:973 length:342 start_codon:yes stop_codon:yes gene_type:complete
MIVLQESVSAQTINFIPRQFVSGDSYNITILNETTNTEVYNQNTTAITEYLYYNKYSAVFPVKQDITYIITVTGSELVYKDKIFCTNQTNLPQYTINSGEYVSNASTNEFITI